MQPTEIFPQNIFQKSNLGLDKNYLNKLHSSIELMRRGDVNGTMISNVEFGWQSKALPQTGPFENLTQKIIKVFCTLEQITLIYLENYIKTTFPKITESQKFLKILKVWK